MTSFKNQITAALKEPFQPESAMFLDADVSLDTMLEGITAEQASTIVPGAGNSLAQQLDHLLVTFDAHEKWVNAESLDDVPWGRSWAIESVTEEQWSEMKSGVCDAVKNFSDHKDGEVAIDEDALIQAATMSAVHLAFHIGQIQLLANLVKAHTA